MNRLWTGFPGTRHPPSVDGPEVPHHPRSASIPTAPSQPASDGLSKRQTGRLRPVTRSSRYALPSGSRRARPRNSRPSHPQVPEQGSHKGPTSHDKTPAHESFLQACRNSDGCLLPQSAKADFASCSHDLGRPVDIRKVPGKGETQATASHDGRSRRDTFYASGTSGPRIPTPNRAPSRKSLHGCIVEQGGTNMKRSSWPEAKAPGCARSPTPARNSWCRSPTSRSSSMPSRAFGGGHQRHRHHRGRHPAGDPGGGRRRLPLERAGHLHSAGGTPGAGPRGLDRPRVPGR